MPLGDLYTWRQNSEEYNCYRNQSISSFGSFYNYNALLNLDFTFLKFDFTHIN